MNNYLPSIGATLVSVDSQTTTEGDYDTAVDLTYDHIETVRYLFRTGSGCVIEVNTTEILTTKSYLEPDFEHLEETGNVVYGLHPSHEPPNRTFYANALASLPERVQKLYLEARSCFVAEGELESEPSTISLAEADLEPLAEISYVAGMQLDLAVACPALVPWVLELNKQAEQIREENGRVNIENLATVELSKIRSWSSYQQERRWRQISWAIRPIPAWDVGGRN